MDDQTSPERSEQPTQEIPSVKSVSPIADTPGSAPFSERTEEVDELGSDAEAYAALKARRAERRRKKLIHRGIAAGIVLAIVVIAIVAVNLMSQQTEDVSTDPIVDYVTRGTFQTQTSAKGTLKPFSATTISPTVEGTVSEVRVVSGQTVAAGDVLMTIKNDELDQAVSDAERTLRDAQADLATAQKALETAKAGTTETDEEGNEVWTEGDTAGAQEQVNTAQRDVESAQSALSQAQAKAAERTVYAPVAGSVIDLNVQSGDMISGGTVSGSGDAVSKVPMQIADLSQMRVTVSVDEENITKIANGQAVEVTFPAIEGLTSQGSVETIATVASDSSSSYYSDGSSASFDVSVLIPSPDSRLKPGMTAQVSIITQQIDDVIMVPTQALLTDDGENYYVRVETDEETHDYKEVDVQVVAQDDNYAVVGRPDDSDGSAGDQAVTGDINDPDAGSADDTSTDSPEESSTSNASLPVSSLHEGDVLIVSLGSDQLADGEDAEAGV